MSEFRGALGSNTGDDFHELWATRLALKLLLNDEELRALTVEGLSKADEDGASPETWDGVDCTLYFGGENAVSASKIELQQLKYSAANPAGNWTASRLIDGPKGKSILGKLAKAWKALVEKRPSTAELPRVSLVSNQPTDENVIEAFRRAAQTQVSIPRRKPAKTAKLEAQIGYATDLSSEQLRLFASVFQFDTGSASRISQEEQLLSTISEWTSQEIVPAALSLREYVRKRMRPEFVGELITRESVLLQLGVADPAALLPCPPEISIVDAPVLRNSVKQATESLLSGQQYVCMHGVAGVGKTTSLQEIEELLPTGSLMIKYDCYGGGRYSDPSGFRHRAEDAYLQISNQLAASLRLPLLLIRSSSLDYPREFMKRLVIAADTLASKSKNALIVVAIDAADNAVTAARNRTPEETPFIWDFVRFQSVPDNVRFIVTTRTGRLSELKLPETYKRFEVGTFNRTESSQNVAKFWNAPEDWIEDFHHLSGGVPRVQAYAFRDALDNPPEALNRLRPKGKSLEEIFRQLFSAASKKNGADLEVRELCAGLISLPRPIPIDDLAAVLNRGKAQLIDLCADLAPGIRLEENKVGFADEDFEDFVRTEGAHSLPAVMQSTADWFLSRADIDPYAAMNLAPALAQANRGKDLLDLVEQQPAPNVVVDPILRRETELQRLRLAIQVCETSGDTERALRFVLLGAEGLETEDAIVELLSKNPDLAASYAYKTSGRLILANSQYAGLHGSFLFQKLALDADSDDRISARETKRLLRAWLQAYSQAASERRANGRDRWSISERDIACDVEAALKLYGPRAALQELDIWSPKRSTHLGVAKILPQKLIAQGDVNTLETVISSKILGDMYSLFVLIPLALSGRSVDFTVVEEGLKTLLRFGLHIDKAFEYGQEISHHHFVLDTVLLACELIVARQMNSETVDQVLEQFLAPELRRIDRCHTHHGSKISLIFRAFVLREYRGGKVPDFKKVFLPREEQTSETIQSHSLDDHDRRLNETTREIFDLYAGVTSLLLRPRKQEDDLKSVEDFARKIESNAWRINREVCGRQLRAEAARHACTLLATDRAPLKVKEIAAIVHGNWCDAYMAPDESVFARLSLQHNLHAELQRDVLEASTKARNVRIGAREKSETLIEFARLIAPINPHEAKSIFNQAVAAAGDLDYEVIFQIKLIDSLVFRGGAGFPDKACTAGRLSNIVADAAIRLDDPESFPWEEAISSICNLDAPLALGNIARWDDEEVVEVHKTLSSFVKACLENGSINAAIAKCLGYFLGKFDETHELIFDRILNSDERIRANLADLSARDALLDRTPAPSERVFQSLRDQCINEKWVNALVTQRNFRADLQAPAESRKVPEGSSESKVNGIEWSLDALVNPSTLEQALTDAKNRLMAKIGYTPMDGVFASARSAVKPRNQIDHLNALCSISDSCLQKVAIKAVFDALEEWHLSSAVQDWCILNIGNIVEQHLPLLWPVNEFEQNPVLLAFQRAKFPQKSVQGILIRGIASHVDNLDSRRIFLLAAHIGSALEPDAAARLADWYTKRLSERIPIEHLDQTSPKSSIPGTLDEAIARFLFAYMCDFDVRSRWRAAYGVRLLAQAKETSILKSFLQQYDRQEDEVFRSRTMPFYWLSGRLWFVVAWSKIVSENSEVGMIASQKLLEIALNETFPHLLVRSFAKDACLTLLSDGELSIEPDQSVALELADTTHLDRIPRLEHHIQREDRASNDERRFQFDNVDTVPYWYAPFVRSFASLSLTKLLDVAEHWIVDVWKINGAREQLNDFRRREKVRDSNWQLTNHRHGSRPILERYQTYLEWNAMWCAIGELLQTEPLTLQDDDHWYSTYDLKEHVEDKKLSVPPLWLSDLLAPTPLQKRFYLKDSDPLGDWVNSIDNGNITSEFLPSDRNDYIIVDGEVSFRSDDRLEEIHISSALVSPSSGAALMRALQSMQSSWDYKLPSDGEDDHEFSSDPYFLVGWISNHEPIDGIDKADPLRGPATGITAKPGALVTASCELMQSIDGAPTWLGARQETSMFSYEVWGKAEDDNERYMHGLRCSGNRLLADKLQVAQFLRSQNLDLIVEVVLTRRGRDRSRGYLDDSTKVPERSIHRLYLLRSGGEIDAVDGRFGSWKCDR
ncbi:hypothetical protein THS27_21550 [Thalassospira sp. MCCC 1A01428]|nr:hypothetical protein THS27_21550 [Thalassospira sp. MCCC 1A01428]